MCTLCHFALCCRPRQPTIEPMSDSVGQTLPAVEPAQPAGARPPNGEAPEGGPEVGALVELRPLDRDSLRKALQDDLGYAQDRAETHDVRAGRWDFVSSSTRLVVALSAAVSSISLLADNTTVTLTFSLLTAIISALNAAFNPPGRSDSSPAVGKGVLGHCASARSALAAGSVHVRTLCGHRGGNQARVLALP
jgi:hypothetical protein